MRIKRSVTYDLGEIRTITLTCVACQRPHILSAEAVQVPDKCPNCGELWRKLPRPHEDRSPAFDRLVKALADIRVLNESAAMPFEISLEFDEPA